MEGKLSSLIKYSRSANSQQLVSQIKISTTLKLPYLRGSVKQVIKGITFAWLHVIVQFFTEDLLIVLLTL